MSAAMLSLLCLPIALLAMRFGLAGGLAAAALSGALAITWAAFDESARLGTLGYALSIATYVLLGALVGLHARRAAAALSAAHELEGRLRRVAERDPLTDLFNRARFEQELERHVEHAARYTAAARC